MKGMEAYTPTTLKPFLIQSGEAMGCMISNRAFLDVVDVQARELQLHPRCGTHKTLKMSYINYAYKIIVSRQPAA